MGSIADHLAANVESRSVTEALLAMGAAGIGGGGGAPSGPAGGVLSGTYPNPDFAEDMATQAELDAAIAGVGGGGGGSTLIIDSTNKPVDGGIIDVTGVSKLIIKDWNISANQGSAWQPNFPYTTGDRVVAGNNSGKWTARQDSWGNSGAAPPAWDSPLIRYDYANPPGMVGDGASFNVTWLFDGNMHDLTVLLLMTSPANPNTYPILTVANTTPLHILLPDDALAVDFHCMAAIRMNQQWSAFWKSNGFNTIGTLPIWTFSPRCILPFASATFIWGFEWSGYAPAYSLVSTSSIGNQ